MENEDIVVLAQLVTAAKESVDNLEEGQEKGSKEEGSTV